MSNDPSPVPSPRAADGEGKPLERLARLACALLDAPIAVLSVHDGERRVLVGAAGLPEPWASRAEPPLDPFCFQVIRAAQLQTVHDARRDAALGGLEAVRALGIAGVAGVPVRAPDGRVAGALSAFDVRPREWSAREMELLRHVAETAGGELDLARRMRAAERERHQAAALLESTGEGIYRIDEHGRCTFINRAGAGLLGYGAAEVLGRNMHELIHHHRADGSPYPEAECPIFRALRSGQGVRVEDDVLWRGDGTCFAARYSSFPIFDQGTLAGAVVTFSDQSERKAAETRLRQSEERYRAIAENATDLITVHAPDGGFTYVSPAAAPLLGYQPEELLGHSLYDLIHPDDLPLVQRAHEQALSGTGAASVRYRKRRRDGRYLWMESTGRVVRDGDTGQVGEIVAVTRDVTRQQESHAALEYLAEAGEILSSSLDYEETLARVARFAVRRLADLCLIDVVEPDGSVRRVAAAHRDPAQAEAARQAMRFAPDPGNTEHPVMRALRTGRTEVIPEWGKDGVHWRARDPEHAALMRSMDPRSSLVVPLAVRERTLGAMHLVTTGRLREYDEQTVRLAEQIAARAAAAIENARLYWDARNAVRIRDEVLAVVSHDLRNPVNTIFMSSSFLLELHGGDPASLLAKQLTIIRRSSERANRLIQDLLDVARLESGRMVVERERVPVQPLVEEVRESFAAQAPGLQITCSVADGTPDVYAEPERLIQVFSNLVGNAVRYTPAGGRIRLGAEPAGSCVAFTVADTGSGIAPEHLPHLFDRFWQAPQTARQGAGLGLAIARGIVEAHGGAIRVQSTVGEGTTFTFTIPVAGS